MKKDKFYKDGLDALQFEKAKEYLRAANNMQVVLLAKEIEYRNVFVDVLHLDLLIAHCYSIKGIKQLVENLKHTLSHFKEDEIKYRLVNKL